MNGKTFVSRMLCNRLLVSCLATALLLGLAVFTQTTPAQPQQAQPQQGERPDDGPPPVRGWNILSDDTTQAEETIRAAASEHGINHLQISHEIVMDLRHVRAPERAMRYYRRIAETGWDQYGGAVVEAPSE